MQEPGGVDGKNWAPLPAHPAWQKTVQLTELTGFFGSNPTPSSRTLKYVKNSHSEMGSQASNKAVNRCVGRAQLLHANAHKIMGDDQAHLP